MFNLFRLHSNILRQCDNENVTDEVNVHFFDRFDEFSGPRFLNLVKQ